MKLEKIIKPTKEWIKNHKSFCIGAGLYMAGAGLDVFSTINAIEQGGVEANPLAGYLIDNFGYLNAAIIHKGSIGALLCFLPILSGNKEEFYRYSSRWLKIGGITQGIVATSNFMMF